MYSYPSSALIFLFSVQGMAAPPSWSKQDTLKQIGSLLYVVCTGRGPAQDIARRDALDHCRTAAADQANGYFKVQALSIETEHAANFHQEISYNKTVTNLACNPQKEYNDDSEGSYRVWIKCRYDLSKAKVVSVDTDEPPSSNSNSEESLIGNRDKLSEVPKSSSEVTNGKLISGENRQLILTTIPQCDEILIRGERPRSIKCDEMPKAIFIYPTDKEIIVRSGGYTPKHIKLNSNRTPANNQTAERVEVYLERQ